MDSIRYYLTHNYGYILQPLPVYVHVDPPMFCNLIHVNTGNFKNKTNIILYFLFYLLQYDLLGVSKLLFNILWVPVFAYAFYYIFH